MEIRMEKGGDGVGRSDRLEYWRARQSCCSLVSFGAVMRTELRLLGTSEVLNSMTLIGDPEMKSREEKDGRVMVALEKEETPLTVTLVDDSRERWEEEERERLPKEMVEFAPAVKLEDSRESAAETEQGEGKKGENDERGVQLKETVEEETSKLLRLNEAMLRER